MNEAQDSREDQLIEEYLRFLRGRGPSPDLSGLPPDLRETVMGQCEIVAALADRDPELPPLEQDPVARRLGLVAAREEPAVSEARNDVAPHAWARQGWRWWLCRHCYAPRSLHPRHAWVRARPLGDHRYLGRNAPHFNEGW